MASTEPPLIQAYWQVVDGDGLFPDAQAVVSFMSPDTSHALLSDPSAAKAMISSLNRIVRALVDEFAVKGSLSMARFSSASMRSRSLDVATKACHCGDDALLGAFMTALPALYKPGCLLKDVKSILGAVWVLLLDELIYRTAERQITDPPTMARQSRHCGPPEDDGLGRARVGRLAISPLLLRLSVEWMSVTVERRTGGMMGCDAPGQSLAVFAVTCPRALLSAVPDVVDTVLAHMAALMDALSPSAADQHMRVLLRTLEGLVVIDPGRLSRAAGAARTLARVHTFLTTGAGRVCPPGAGATDTVLRLLCVVGGTWTALAAAPTADAPRRVVRGGPAAHWLPLVWGPGRVARTARGHPVARIQRPLRARAARHRAPDVGGALPPPPWRRRRRRGRRRRLGARRRHRRAVPPRRAGGAPPGGGHPVVPRALPPRVPAAADAARALLGVRQWPHGGRAAQAPLQVLRVWGGDLLWGPLRQGFVAGGPQARVWGVGGLWRRAGGGDGQPQRAPRRGGGRRRPWAADPADARGRVRGAAGGLDGQRRGRLGVAARAGATG